MLSPLTWTAGESLPAGRDHAVALSDGYKGIFLLGGSTSAVLRQSGSGLAPWTTAPALDLGRNGLGAAWSSQGIVAFGGKGGQTYDESVFYDPTFGDNQDTATMHSPRYLLGSGSGNGLVYAIGGINGSTVLKTVEAYDAGIDQWKFVSPLPTGLYGFSTVDDGAGHFYTFGGATTSSATSVSNLVYRYDVDADKWTAMTPLPTAVREAAAALGSDGFIYVMGGATAAGETAIVQRYDIATDTWMAEPSLPVAVRGAAAITDNQGRLEVIGGLIGNTPQTSVFVSQQLNLPDTAPTFTSKPILNGSADQIYTYQVAATGNPLPTLALISGPAGMSMDAYGLITWQPTAAEVGTQDVVVRASNFAGSFDQSFSVKVVLEIVPPTVPTNVHVTSVTASTISLAWDPATDNTGVAGYTVYLRTRYGYRPVKIRYSAIGTTTGTTFVLGGIASNTTKIIVVRAFDASGNISGNSNATSTTTYRIPTLSLSSGGSPVVSALHTLAFSLYSYANPRATFSLVSGPLGMTVDADTGLVKWIPNFTDVGTVPAIFRATNIVGSTDLNVNITVLADVPILSYAINPGTGPGYAVGGTPISIQLHDYSLTPSTYSIVSGPASMTIDPTTGLTSWTPTPADAGTTNVVFHATNSAGSANLPIRFTTYFTGKSSNITALNITAGSATVSWTAPADTSNIVGYVISLRYRYRFGRGYTSRTLTFTSNSTATSFNATGLTANKTYTPSVYAINAAGQMGEQGSGLSFVARTVVVPPPAQAAAPELPIDSTPASPAAAAGAGAKISAASAASGITWNVSLDDPNGTWAAYYSDIARMIQAAGAEWSGIFDSNAFIEVVVGFDPTLDSSSARSVTTAYLETDANGYDIYEQGAAAEINTGVDPNGTGPDVQINIGVNPTANFLTDSLWFDPDPAARTTPIPAGKIDALSAMLHDLGHAIGFNGWADPATGDVPGNYASTFDQYIYAAGTGLAFNGAYANDTLGHDPSLAPGRVYDWSGSAAAELLDAAGLQAGTRYDISPLDVAVMKDIGMSMDSAAPNVVGAKFNVDTRQSITVQFNESVRASFDAGDFSLLWIGPSGVQNIPAANMQIDYDRKTNTATITFPGVGSSGLADGEYVFTLSPWGVTDLAGNALANEQMLTFKVLAGDSNGDGRVDADDYFNIDRGFVSQLTGYANGDFDFNGVVDASDYFLIDRAFAQQGSGAAGAPVAKTTTASLSAARLGRHHKAHTARTARQAT